ncbi:hypothetical protein [Bacillus sp. OTU530]|uniref:hypothetical protein n=1 Tax=Bacillus sp. OTU530 TaxID=3043862 RepID=UPI00313DE518
MRRAIIVVDKNIVIEANNDAATIDTSGGEFTFTTGVSNDGVNLTDYWCSWVTTEEDYNKLVTLFNKAPERRLFDGDIYTPEQVLLELGLKMIEIESDI